MDAPTDMHSPPAPLLAPVDAATALLVDAKAAAAARHPNPLSWDARLALIGPRVPHPNKPGAPAIAVKDADTYRVVTELLLAVKALQTAVVEAHEPVTKHWHEKWQAACRERKDELEPLTRYEELLKGGIAYFDDLAEKQRIEQQRAAQQKAAEEAEQARLEEAARLESLALATGDAELKAEAEAVLEQPVAPMTTFVPSSRPSVSGIGLPKKWVGGLDPTKPNAFDLVFQAAAQRPELRALFTFDTGAATKLAAVLQGSMNQIPGLRAWQETQVRAARK